MISNLPTYARCIRCVPTLGAALLVAASLLAASAPSPVADPAKGFRIVPVDDPNIVGVQRGAPPLPPLTAKAPAKRTADPVDDLPPTDSVWQTDYAAALRRAAREEKLVLLNFTGSDWCGWCVRLEAAVFSKPEFLAYADQHLVLLKVDFPRKKRLPPAEAAQNARLQQQFTVRGYPTLIVVDSTGRKIAEIDPSARSSPRAFIAAFERQARR
jgi:protein disulfide-isomerase